MKTRSSLLVLALAGALLLMPAAPASAQLDKCQKSISKEVLKLQNQINKALNKCADSVQKQLEKDKPLTDVSGKCNAQLDKAINADNASSAISKAMGKLAELGPSGKATCSDSDLFSLGHLPENAFGDRWTKVAAIAAWQAGYDNASHGNPTMSFDLGSLSLAGPGCPLCLRAATPPCLMQTCKLAAGSGGPINTSGGPIPIVLNGAANAGRCDVPSIMDAGETAIVSGSQQGIVPIDVAGLANACIFSLTSLGVENCGGTLPTVDLHACTDHIVDGGVDECETGAPIQFCGNDVDDANHEGTVNGGMCTTLTLGPPADGSSFSLVRNRIQVILPGEEGPDGLACTLDDEPAMLVGPFNSPTTTGTASAQLIDPDNNDAAADLTTGLVIGSPVDCNLGAQGDLSGSTTVSGFAALHALLGLDLTSRASLICE